jgi:ATP/maltotriose-dependent transcriptional regulator MalT
LAARDHQGMHFQPACWRTVELFAASRRGRMKDVFPDLTMRGHRVLDLIAAGRGNADIGGELVLSLKAVRDHGSDIFARLQVAGRVRGIVRADGAGLGG